MKRRVRLFPLFCAIGLASAGCSSDGRNRGAPLTGESSVFSVDGQNETFTSFGFYALSDELRGKVLSAYDGNGKLDHERIKNLLPNAKFEKVGGVCRVWLVNEPFPMIDLMDGPLVSLGPKFDAVISGLAEIFSRKKKRLPVFPLR